MNENEWKRYAAQNLKSELVKAGISYDVLVERLKMIGVEESYSGIASKVNRGTFSFLFFAQCMQAIGKTTVHIDPKGIK